MRRHGSSYVLEGISSSCAIHPRDLIVQHMHQRFGLRESTLIHALRLFQASIGPAALREVVWTSRMHNGTSESSFSGSAKNVVELASAVQVAVGSVLQVIVLINMILHPVSRDEASDDQIGNCIRRQSNNVPISRVCYGTNE